MNIQTPHQNNLFDLMNIFQDFIESHKQKITFEVYTKQGRKKTKQKKPTKKLIKKKAF